MFEIVNAETWLFMVGVDWFADDRVSGGQHLADRSKAVLGAGCGFLVFSRLLIHFINLSEIGGTSGNTSS